MMMICRMCARRRSERSGSVETRGDPREFKRWMKSQHFDADEIGAVNFILALLEFGRQNNCTATVVEWLDELEDNE